MFAALVPEAWMALALLSVAYSSLTVAATGISPKSRTRHYWLAKLAAW